MEKKLTRSQQGAVTKQKLTDAALTLFAQKGYQNVSIAQICGQVGVTVGVFYHYFRAKSDVFKVISLGGDEKIRAYEFRSDSALGQVSELLRYYGKITEEIGLDTMRVIITPANGLIYTNNYAFKLTVSLLEKGQKSGEVSSEAAPEIQARMLFSIAWGEICLWCQEKNKSALSQQIEESVSAAIAGLKK